MVEDSKVCFETYHEAMDIFLRYVLDPLQSEEGCRFELFGDELFLDLTLNLVQIPDHVHDVCSFGPLFVVID
jgi:hypothetical protein